MDLRLACVISISCASVMPILAQGGRSLESEGATLARRSALDIVSRFLTATPSLISYRAKRVLEASTRGGRMAGALEAWTWLDPDGSFHYEVTDQRGSGLIRQRVLVAALDEERRTRNERDTGADLIPENYDFHVSDDGTRDLLQILLSPRRQSPRLLEGVVFTTREDVDLVRVEGRLSQRPSFWTKRVDVIRRYARVAGVRVPVEMRSRADVRIVGESTFSMTYDYVEINGRPVSPVIASRWPRRDLTWR